MEQSENSSDSHAPISVKERFGYGMGDFASNLVFAALGSFLTFYYTDIAGGVSAALIGTIMLASRIFDGVSDLEMGAVVDKTRSKHGKARPWLLWLCLPFLLSSVLIFTIPETDTWVTIVYIVLTYNLFNLIYTGINIPYGVLNSLISQDQYQRSMLNVFRMGSAVTVTMLVGVITLPLTEWFGGGQTGWVFTFGLFAGVSVLLFLFTFSSTKERVNTPVQKKDQVPLKTGLKALTKTNTGFSWYSFSL